jgi:hypothetical protein
MGITGKPENQMTLEKTGSKEARRSLAASPQEPGVLPATKLKELP